MLGEFMPSKIMPRVMDHHLRYQTALKNRVFQKWSFFRFLDKSCQDLDLKKKMQKYILFLWKNIGLKRSFDKTFQQVT